VTDCAVCVAAEFASDETLASLVRRQAVTIDRLRSNLDTFALVAARGRIRELEETLERVNRTRPASMAVEVCRDLAEMDPRTNDGPQECFFCCQPAGQHRKDCSWRRATAAVDQVKRDEKRRRAS
jgi:hypothetical protein